ncbi:MAG: hypothetical protein DCC68_01145 [Planctomycetota bacterium]|nr:MAG: hypothetical protein DCC68_01145 [Planctomycetota bacterium]
MRVHFETVVGLALLDPSYTSFSMRVIGVLGGVASGKSRVTRMLAELGCGVLDADKAGHEVLREVEVKQALRDRWGEAILDDGGEIDRHAVARIVFGPPATSTPKPTGGEIHIPTDQSPRDAAAERRFLEQLTHGRIAARLRQQADAFAAGGRVKAIVVDAALLVEAGWDAMCDVLVYVDAPRETRLARAKGRGWTEAEFDAREGAQETLQAKRQHADFEIDNSGDLEQLRGWVERFWSAFLTANPA